MPVGAFAPPKDKHPPIGRLDHTERVLKNFNPQIVPLLDSEKLLQQLRMCYTKQACCPRPGLGETNFIMISFSGKIEIESELVSNVKMLHTKKPIMILVPRVPRWICILWDGRLESVKNTQFVTALIRDYIIGHIEQPVEERVVSSLQGVSEIIAGGDLVQDNTRKEMIVYNSSGIYGCATEENIQQVRKEKNLAIISGTTMYGSKNTTTRSATTTSTSPTTTSSKNLDHDLMDDHFERNPFLNATTPSEHSSNSIVGRPLTMHLAIQQYWDLFIKFAKTISARKVLKIHLNTNKLGQGAAVWPNFHFDLQISLTNTLKDMTFANLSSTVIDKDRHSGFYIVWYKEHIFVVLYTPDDHQQRCLKSSVVQLIAKPSILSYLELALSESSSTREYRKKIVVCELKETKDLTEALATDLLALKKRRMGRTA